MHLKFKANDLKEVKVIDKISLQSKSSCHIHSNACIKLKVVVLKVYTYIYD